MESKRTTVSVSKSSPSLKNRQTYFPAAFHKLRPDLKKPFPLVRVANDCKRTIVANTEKGVIHRPYWIFEKGINYTPEALYDPSYPSASSKLFSGLPAAKPLGRADGVQETSFTSSMHSIASRFSISRRSRPSAVTSLISTGFVSEGGFSFTALDQGIDEEEVEIIPGDKAPSLFRLREDPPPKNIEFDLKFKITLRETEPMFLLQIPSTAESIGSEAGRDIMVTNAKYEKVLQTSKTISHTATQTTRVFHMHRKLYMPKNKRANSSAFATVWDIYDSYQDQQRGSVDSTLESKPGKTYYDVDREEEVVAEEPTFLGLKFGGRFLDSLMIMERLISKTCYSSEQLAFQGLLLEDPLSLQVKYNYTLKHLWTFNNKLTEKKKVTTMCWSSQNHNVLAVGYGKFKYTDKCHGLVCIWNVKNPDKPERFFEFTNPVTHVSFSDFRSQILAVSFYNGLVLLVDISSRSLLIKASNQFYPLYYPVWQTLWFPYEGQNPGQILLTCGKNGLVYKYTKTKFFISKKIMSMGRPHGNIQGVVQPRKCYARKTLSSQHPSAEVLIRHPRDHLMYLIGTSEGCVYFCSVNHRHDYIDVFVAHNGPVYAIKFNPFCSKVLLTSGADWCIRIWAEGIFEPLITLESGMTPVQDALWNPLHSTIIVSITGSAIDVWDIRRKTATPKSTTKSPTDSFNTVMQFSENKYNLCVGDVDGNVHVLALTEMPFSPAYQEEVLAQSIRNMLISRPNVLGKLLKLGHPFASEGSTYKDMMYSKLDHLHKVL